MDPGPSSASADPSPSPSQPPPEEEEEEREEEREGDGEEEGCGGGGGSTWVVVPAGEVLGAGSPKVVGWEELQQELARLWSLSAARDCKTGLESALELVCMFC